MIENPEPIPNGNDPIYLMVISDMEKRAIHGKNTYGTFLQAHNGRNALQDLYEELLDACVYLKQYMIETHVVASFLDDSLSSKAYISHSEKRKEAK